MTRGIRVRDTLRMIGREPEEPHMMMRDRSIHRDELIDIIMKFVEDERPFPEVDLDDMKVTEMRTLIREELFGGSTKSPESKLSAMELLRLQRKVDQLKYLEADQLDFGYHDISRGDKCIVNGERYEVDAKLMGSSIEPPDVLEMMPVSDYWNFLFDDKRMRMMVLFDLNKRECKYVHSVVLEKARDYGPYKRWVKDSYVKEVALE